MKALSTAILFLLLMSTASLVQAEDSKKTQNEIARSGCCSHHGGVCGCSGGRARCCDGRLSPSCGCYKDTLNDGRLSFVDECLNSTTHQEDEKIKSEVN